MKRSLLSVLTLLFSSLCGASSGYLYPIDNPLAATVLGTPKEFSAALPKDIRGKEMQITVFPDRVPKKFIPRTALNYTLVKQKQEAPLISP